MKFAAVLADRQRLQDAMNRAGGLHVRTATVRAPEKVRMHLGAKAGGLASVLGREISDTSQSPCVIQ